MIRSKPVSTWILALMLSASGAAFAQPAAPAAPAAPAHNDASTPEAKIDATGKPNQRFMTLHEAFLHRGKEAPMDVLFLGDSITEGWLGKGLSVWKREYWKYTPANFGIGGDRTEHVLWRMDNKELNGIHPKVVVLMIGTNNTGSNTGDEIAAADVKIVKELREKLPETKVLVLAIFPRGPRKAKDGSIPENAAASAAGWMTKINTANEALAKLDDGSNIRYLDIGDKFLVDGKIPDDIMPDQLHPNEKGYNIWADAMQPLLDEMMK